MTNVSITRGCVEEPAEQFQEGADTYVCVCDQASASLLIYSEESCIVVVKADGVETLNTPIEPNKSYEFPLSQILKSKRSRGHLPRPAFLGGFGFFGGGSKGSPAEQLPSDFLVEIRLNTAGAPLDGSYRFRLLSDQAFNQRFAGYMSARVTDEPKPIFTRDARPIECLANETKCAACGTVITDCIAGCENGDCPTVTGAEHKATGTAGSGDKDAKPIK